MKPKPKPKSATAEPAPARLGPKHPKADVKSRGAVALLRTGKSQDAIADTLETTRGNIASYIAGRWRPGPDMRAKIREEFGIADADWDLVYEPRTNGATSSPTPAPGVAIDLATLPSTAAGHIALLRSHVLERWNELAAANMLPAERAKSAKLLAEALEKLAGAEVEQQAALRYVELPCFARLLELLERHLAGLPEALAALRADVELERAGEA